MITESELIVVFIITGTPLRSGSWALRSYDSVMDRTSNGQSFRMLTLMDEHTRECLAIDVARSLKSEDLLERLSDLFIRRGVPKYIRSDDGSEFTAHKVRD